MEMFTRTCRKYCSSVEISKLKTIYALSTGQTRAGVAVVRVSGSSCRDALVLMTKIPVKSGLNARQLYVTPIKHPNTKEIIDKGMAVWFPGPSTFTGEDVCEFHVHGGRAVVDDLLEALGTIPNFVPAEPGQFTKRAFCNGKLDLTAVEGLADLLKADTSAQRKLALRQVGGELNKLYNNWRSQITKCVAHVEAVVDFGEEEQIDDDVLEKVNLQVTRLRDEVRRHLADSRSGELLRNGVHVTIVGRPNVGKSSLLNLLCRRPAAIVAPSPGTTRDALEVPVNLAGYPVVLTDTAGVRHGTDDAIEREGVRRALEKLRRADLLLYVVDASTCQLDESNALSELDEFFNKAADESDSDLNRHVEHRPEIIVVFNKIDLIEDRSRLEPHGSVTSSNEDTFGLDRARMCKNKAVARVNVSCTESIGIDCFLEIFAKTVASMCNKSLAADTVSFTHQRHRYHVTRALHRFDDYFLYNSTPEKIVLAAESLRSALKHLGQLTGHVTTEQILDVVFRDFCIGK